MVIDGQPNKKNFLTGIKTSYRPETNMVKVTDLYGSRYTTLHRSRQCCGSVNIFFGPDRVSVTLNYGSGSRRPINWSYLDSLRPLKQICCQEKYQITKYHKLLHFYWNFFKFWKIVRIWIPNRIRNSELRSVRPDIVRSTGSGSTSLGAAVFNRIQQKGKTKSHHNSYMVHIKRANTKSCDIEQGCSHQSNTAAS